MTKRGFYLVAVFLMCSVAMAADIYKWVDADGKVHYSNTPPPSVNAKKIKLEDPAPSAGGGAPAPSAEYWRQKDEEFRKRQEEKSNVAKEASDKVATEEAEKRKQTCEFYRKDLEQVLSTRERVMRSADGKDIVVDPNSTALSTVQRARVIGELNEAIAKHCN